jgi:hypothetical protein
VTIEHGGNFKLTDLLNWNNLMVFPQAITWLQKNGVWFANHSLSTYVTRRRIAFWRLPERSHKETSVTDFNITSIVLSRSGLSSIRTRIEAPPLRQEWVRANRYRLYQLYIKLNSSETVILLLLTRFNREDGGNIFLWIIGDRLHHCTLSDPRSPQLEQWQPRLGP